MFDFLKKIFGKKTKPNKFAIPASVKAKAIPEEAAYIAVIGHKRVGDYCNGCKKHVSECPIHKRLI